MRERRLWILQNIGGNREMRKILLLLKETFYLIRKYKIYFLAPILLILILLAIICIYIGPKVVISFIYAGI